MQTTVFEQQFYKMKKENIKLKKKREEATLAMFQRLIDAPIKVRCNIF